MKNWKTTLAGIIVTATVIATSFHWIDSATATNIIALAASFGLVAAKDSNVTGK